VQFDNVIIQISVLIGEHFICVNTQLSRICS